MARFCSGDSQILSFILILVALPGEFSDSCSMDTWTREEINRFAQRPPAHEVKAPEFKPRPAPSSGPSWVVLETIMFAFPDTSPWTSTTLTAKENDCTWAGRELYPQLNSVISLLCWRVCSGGGSCIACVLFSALRLWILPRSLCVAAAPSAVGDPPGQVPMPCRVKSIY